MSNIFMNSVIVPSSVHIKCKTPLLFSVKNVNENTFQKMDYIDTIVKQHKEYHFYNCLFYSKLNYLDLCNKKVYFNTQDNILFNLSFNRAITHPDVYFLLHQLYSQKYNKLYLKHNSLRHNNTHDIYFSFHQLDYVKEYN